MLKYLSVVLTFLISMFMFGASSIDRLVAELTPSDEPKMCLVQPQPERSLDKRQHRHYTTVVSKYRVSDTMVKDVIHFAYQYEKKTFPKAEDILAVIGIESSWNPMAQSKLKTDPALGLTQIRPGQWKKLIDHPTELLDIENQIRYAAEILHINYRLTKSVEDAIIAYNVGYGAWLNGDYSLNYLTKFQNERSNFRRTAA